MSKRNGFKASFERLENRQLMAGDLSFNPQTGALTIIGTRAGDQVVLSAGSSGSMSVRLNQSTITVSPTAVRSIFMDLGAGTDRVGIGQSGPGAPLNPDSINIRLGTGVRDEVSMSNVSATRINIDARASRDSIVSLYQSVCDRVVVDMGTDTAADRLSLLASDIDRLDARMGGGSDVIEVLHSSIQRANVSMGDGDDKVISHGTDGYVGAGTIDGGAGDDTIDELYRNRGRKFERIWSW